MWRPEKQAIARMSNTPLPRGVGCSYSGSRDLYPHPAKGSSEQRGVRRPAQHVCPTQPHGPSQTACIRSQTPSLAGALIITDRCMCFFSASELFVVTWDVGSKPSECHFEGRHPQESVGISSERVSGLSVPVLLWARSSLGRDHFQIHVFIFSSTGPGRLQGISEADWVNAGRKDKAIKEGCAGSGESIVTPQPRDHFARDHNIQIAKRNLIEQPPRAHLLPH